MSASVSNPMVDAEQGITEGTGGRSLGRQITLLMRKTMLMKQRALKWTLLEIFFPLYPICFLWLIFKFGADFLPYEKIETEAVSLMPAVSMLNTSLPGLAFMVSKGGKIGFAPVNPGSANAARVVQNTVCSSTAAIFTAASFPAMDPDLCKLYESPEIMNKNQGWMPSFEAVESVNADHVDAAVEDQGMYLGVEVDAKGLTIRHEDMLLVADMSGDLMEKNAGVVGLHAIQALSSYALINYNVCSDAYDACGDDCLAATTGLAAAMEQLMPLCAADPAAAVCTAAVEGVCARTGITDEALTDCSTQLLGVATCIMNNMSPALMMAGGWNFYMEEFPVLATIKLVNFRKFMYPMLFLTVLFINIQATLTQIGQEKERGIKNALALKGMRKEAFWSTWFLGEGMVLTVSTIIVTVGAKLVGVIEHTSMLHFYASIWIYGISLILMAFVLSSFFTKAKTMFIAAAMMLIVFSVIAYVVELLFIRQDILGLPYAANLCLFLFSPIPFGHLMWTLSSGELQGTGWAEGLTRLEWNIENDYYYEAYVFLVIDCFLYIGLTLVLDSYFGDPLSFGRAPKTTDGTKLTPDMGISIRSLSKLFQWTEKAEGWAGIMGKKIKNEVQAVDGLDLDVAKNQICCLLGHNGAGKTTTMLLLAGLEAPDSGAATVAGFNIVEDRDEMRQNLGMCPQHDILYDELTNLEHLQLYGSIQGLSDAEANSEADRLLAAVGLTSKAGDLACQMSGGQRRRLSLAVSLIGCPAAAFLDEPTTGMDPHNRQLCWKLLQREKKTCTMLLTTHSMEEADLLGDVLAVMDKGKLQVSGTSMELKNKYGSGYGLTCVKTSKDVASDPIINLVTSSIEGGTVRTDIGTELSFALPMQQSKNFVGLFRSLESEKSLGIASFGLTQTSLEEVFLNLAEMNDHSAETTGSNATANQKVTKEPFPQFKCEPSFGGQLNAVLYQVSLQSLRYPIAVVYLVIMPAIFTYLATLVVPYMKNDPPAPVDMLAVVTDAKFKDDVERDPCGEHMWAGSMPFAAPNDVMGPALLRYDTCNLLVDELEKETHDLTKHPFHAACYNTNGTDGQGLQEWGFSAGGLSLLYNGTEIYSSRAALACAYKQIAEAAGIPGGIQTSYKSYTAKVGSNALGGGAMMAFVANIFMILSGYYCEEQIRLRVERVKEMMLLCGLPRLTYWLAYFVSHFIFFFLSWNLSYFIMWTSGGMDGINDNSAFCYYLLAIVAGSAFIIYGYLLSFVTDDILAAQQWVNEYLNLTFGLPFMILTFAVQDEDTRATLENFFGILPGFAFYKGIGVLEAAATNKEPFTAGDTFDWDRGLLKYICFLIFDVFLFSFLLFVIDTNLIGRLTGPKLADTTTITLDDDQKQLVDKIPPVEGATLEEKSSNLAHAHKLSKKYPLEGGGSVQAVVETSIGVAKNEVLGLLGPNGAGKTTMVSMLSGVEDINSGEAWINDASVNTELAEARKLLGLCPQFDALMANLTAREHLKIFAMIRGVPADIAPDLIDRTIADMDLSLKADERTSGYSGGNKRKLSVALSMVANPTVNFLDEPSTGMDPETRRFMWNYIASVREGRALVLTTHSMEEADALCSKIGIMIRGQLRALGSSQQLKSQYGEGFQCMIRLGDEKVEAAAGGDSLFSAVDQVMNGLSKSGSVKCERAAHTILRYELPAADTDLATIFETIESKQEELEIVDFSVSQTTLEDGAIRCRLQSAAAPTGATAREPILLVALLVWIVTVQFF